MTSRAELDILTTLSRLPFDLGKDYEEKRAAIEAAMLAAVMERAVSNGGLGTRPTHGDTMLGFRD